MPPCRYHDELRQTNQTRKHKHMEKSADSISQQVLEKFWAENYLISSRSNQKGVQYAMEEYIQNFKIHAEDDNLKFSWYSGLPHTLIHITLFLVPLWLGKRDEMYPILQTLGIPRLSVLHVPQAYRLNHVFQHKSTMKQAPPCCFQWSCPSWCPSIVDAGMSLAHLHSKGKA